MRVGIRRLPLAAGLAVLVTALLPGAAHAAFGIASFDGQTYQADQTTLFTQAGGHPVFGITTYAVNTTGGVPDGFPDTVKNIRIDAPPGLITNPEAVPRCADPTPATCAPTSIIGDIQLTAYFPVPIDLDAGGPLPPFGPGTVTLPTIPVYNMQQSAGQVSDFAFGLGPGTLIPRIDIIGGVRDTGDYGTYFTISDAAPVPSLVSSKLRFYGNPGLINPAFTTASFLSLPTQCAQGGTTKLTIESQSGQTATATVDNPPATGCDQVPFSAGLSVAPSTTRRDAPSGGDVNLTVPQSFDDPSKIATSHVKDVAIKLPPGFTLNPSAANGLEACTDAQFGKGTHNPIACPAASRIGNATIETPALRDVPVGAVYLGSSIPGDRYRIFVNAKAPDSGVDVRLIGSIKPDAATGQITAVFSDNPQVPFSSFRIVLDPAKQTLATPPVCGTSVTTSVISPNSGNAPATPSSTATIDQDPNGGSCTSPAFAPGFAVADGVSQAGADTSYAATFTRPDGQQFLDTVANTLPEGLLGRIPAVPLCSEADAAAGTCGDASRIGTATVAAGAGDTPFSLSGPVYLTGPYKGAPYGLSIVVRAIAGPFDLGTVVVRAAIRIDPRTAKVSVESDPLPRILEGVPLRLRVVSVKADRPGFLFNGTGCEARRSDASTVSTSGATAAATAPVQYTGCDKLAFTPKLTGWTDGRQTTKTGTALYTTLRQPGGQVNLRSVSVQLPTGFSARGTTLKKACLRTTFNADPTKCPKESAVGNAVAMTPTLPFDLTGTAYLVARETGGLPTIEVVLDRNLVKIQFGSEISYSGRYTATFAPTPDAPVTQFRLNFPAGEFSSLVYTSKTSLCSRGVTLPTTFTGQDGRTVKQNAPLNVENCPVKITGTKTLARGRAQITVRAPESGRLTVSGKGIVSRAITLATPVKALKVTVLRRSPGIRSSAVTVRLVPGKKAQAASPVRLTPSTARATVRFGAAAAVRPTFTG